MTISDVLSPANGTRAPPSGGTLTVSHHVKDGGMKSDLYPMGVFYWKSNLR